MARTKKRDSWFFSPAAFGEELRRRREEAGYSLMGLSRAVEKATANPASGLDGFSISQTAIMKWEKGESVPTVDNLVAIAATLYPTEWADEITDIIGSGVSLACLETSLYALISSYAEFATERAELAKRRIDILQRQAKLFAELGIWSEVSDIAEQMRNEYISCNGEIEDIEREANGMLLSIDKEHVGLSLQRIEKPNWEALEKLASDELAEEAEMTADKRAALTKSKDKVERELKQRLGINGIALSTDEENGSTAREG